MNGEPPTRTCLQNAATYHGLHGSHGYALHTRTRRHHACGLNSHSWPCGSRTEARVCVEAHTLRVAGPESLAWWRTVPPQAVGRMSYSVRLPPAQPCRLVCIQGGRSSQASSCACRLVAADPSRHRRVHSPCCGRVSKPAGPSPHLRGARRPQRTCGPQQLRAGYLRPTTQVCRQQRPAATGHGPPPTFGGARQNASRLDSSGATDFFSFWGARQARSSPFSLAPAVRLRRLPTAVTTPAGVW